MVRGDNMAVCYKKLWKMLIDKDMIKKRNRKEAKHLGSFLSVYSVFDQRTVPFL